jgi:membrane associated rhomboid family serine protease
MIPLRDTQRSESRPYVVILLILLNVLVFAFEVSLTPARNNLLLASWAIVPDQFKVHSLVSYMFLHGGWMHIIGNMWFLWIFGDNVEDAFGHARFLAFYLICGVSAGLLHLALNLGSPVPTVGASGAIAGVMGAYMVKFPHSRILTLVPIIIFLTTIEIPAVFMLLYWLLIQVVSGAYSMGASVTGGGTAWFAHVGGFVAGVVLGWMWKSRPRQRVVAWHDDY